MYLGERRGAIVVVRELGRFLARELRAVLPELIVDHGLHRELQAAEIRAAAAMDRTIGRPPAAALAMSELADDLLLAVVDLLLAQIDLWLEPRRGRRVSSELASGDGEGTGDEAGAGDGGS